MDVIVTPTKFTIAGYFSITDTEDYELLKINAVPEKLEDNTFKEVQVTTSIFGVNSKLERYFETAVDDIKRATMWNDTTFILQPSIFLDIDSSRNCIIQQLYKKLTFEKCPTRRINISNILWKELWT